MNEIEPVTPGPWETSDGPHRKAGPLGWPQKWRYVQHNFPDAPYEGELSDEWGIYPPMGEAGPVALVAGEANAKLIAAAPDLLEALKDLLEHHYDEPDRPAVRHARGVVQKATGASDERGRE